ncbi:hypothetical protein Hanom_Chr09g00786251 [Helianthus anomalus]
MLKTSQIYVSLITSLVTTLGSWKDRFFWVSESVIPFKMSDDTSDVIHGDAEVVEGKDAITRTAEGRLVPGGKYVSEDQGVEAEDKKDKESPMVVVVSTARGSPERVVKVKWRLMLCLQSCFMLPEGVSHFRKRMHEYEEFSKKKDKMKASMATMKKQSEGFAKKEKAWVIKVGEFTSRHEVEMNELKKRMEVDKLQLKDNTEALNVQNKAFLEEKKGLKASLAQVTSDNQWQIEHRFQQVVTYILHSKEFKSALGDVYTKLLNNGKHPGFVVGYKAHESRHPQERSSFYQPQAFAPFKESVLNMERLTYPYVGEVSSCFGKPLSMFQELKPSGLNEVVCAEVLKSLSKKHSHSGDSEETFSDCAEGSLEASLEGSEVSGDGARKVKKVKKAKKAKAGEAGAGAYKPTSDVPLIVEAMKAFGQCVGWMALLLFPFVFIGFMCCLCFYLCILCYLYLVGFSVVVT